MKGLKNFALLGLCVLAGMSLVNAEYNECLSSFNTKQANSIVAMSKFVVNNKILLQTKFGLATDALDEFNQKLINTVDCNGWGFYSYDDYIASFQSMIMELKASKFENFQSDSESRNAILLLQNHLLSAVQFGFDVTKPMKSTSKINIDADINMPDEDMVFKAKGEINMDGKYDMKEGKFDNNLDLSGQLEAKMDGENMQQGSLKMNLDMMKTKDIYLKLNSFNLQQAPVTGIDAASDFGGALAISMINTAVNQITGKYINLTSGSDMPISMDMMMGTLNPMALFGDIKTQPMMKFYKEGDTTRYGTFDNNVCASLAKLIPSIGIGDEIRSCKKSLRELLLQNGGKGYIKLTRENNQYVLGMSNKDLLKEMPALNEIVSWDGSNINKISVPLGDKGKGNITYQNGLLKGNYDDEESQFALTGDLAANTKNISMKVKDKNEKIDVIISINYKKTDNKYDMYLKIDIQKDGQTLGTVNLSNSEAIEYLNSLNLQNPINVWDLDQLGDAMDGLFSNF